MLTSVLLVLVVALCVAPIIGRRERVDVMSPPVVVGGAVLGFVVIRAVFMLLTNYTGILGFEASSLHERVDMLTRALWVVALGLAAYHLGYAVLSPLSAGGLPHFS